MVRLSLAAFLALAFSGVAFATPVVSDLRARDSVPFIPCQGTGVVTNVDVSPIPSAPGAQTIVTISGYAAQEISIGSFATVTALEATQPLSNERVDICATANCPIRAGSPYSFSFDFSMPAGTPINAVHVITQGFSSGPVPIFCADFKPVPGP